MMTATKLSLKKSDLVEVISGREKGKTGKIVKVDLKKMRVTIEKVNMVKRHVKPSQSNPQGGILEKEQPLHYSNVLLVCPKCNKGSRIGHKVVDAAVAPKKAAKGIATSKNSASKSKKIRFCRRCDQTIDQTA